jgi:hypothetical protein
METGPAHHRRPSPTLTLVPAKGQGQVVSVQLQLGSRLPAHDERLPHVIEANVHQDGLEVLRALFRTPIEHADRQSQNPSLGRPEATQALPVRNREGTTK